MQPVRVLRSKLAVPRLEEDVWVRPELNKKMEKIRSSSVTVVQAGAGYGKTTAVTQVLAGMRTSFCWYSAGPEDASPLVFGSCLAAALDALFPGTKEKFNAAVSNSQVTGWEKVLDAFLFCLEGSQRDDRETGILVVDDWHLISENQDVGAFFDRFLAGKPSWLQVAVLSRETVNIPEVCRLGLRGEKLQIGEKDLAFSAQEVYEYLVRVSGCRLSREDARRICQFSEGWVIAVKLIGKGMKEGAPPSLEAVEDSSLTALFDFLARDVLERQDEELQSFLLKSSILEYLNAPACAAVIGGEFTPRLIQRAVLKGLFLTELDGGLYRYHNLFRNFLRREARKRLSDWELLHCRAGYFYLQEGRQEEALQHLLCGRQWADTARVLALLANGLVYSGRAQLLRRYLEKLPPELQKKPEFLIALGDAERLASNYQVALKFYREAEKGYAAAGDGAGQGKALRGTGEVYIDIIQPELAQQFLRRAYKVVREQGEKAEILNLLAENMINQGKPRQAKRYQQLAGEMFHLGARGNLEARLLLRTGRLETAIGLLEGRLQAEKEGYHPPVSFRETPLLLSLCYSFVGEAQKAAVAAEEGIRLGKKLNSPFVEAIGYVRLGHALLVRDGRPSPACREAYRTALELNDRLGVIRGRTEVLMGQCLLSGLTGDWLAARRCGREGMTVTMEVKDRWFTAVLCHCLGVAAVNCRLFAEATDYLVRAREMFSRCGDSFGKAAATWWLARTALKTGREADFCREAALLLELCEGRGYDFLLLRGTLLGARDGRDSVFILSEARRREISPAYVDWLLQKSGASALLPGAGYTLRIQTLGKFRVWRGEEEIEPAEWRRDSARRLLMLFLTRRRQLLHKEEIMAFLWPEAEPETALRDFKVALNTLLNVLEPGRQPRSPSFFIQREGAAYYFNLASGFWLDAEEFENLVARAEKVCADWPEQAEIQLKRALELYTGDYLPGLLLDEWCLQERERLAVIYLRAAELLARLLVRRGDCAASLKWIEKILEKDNCWEEAYRLQMICYARLGNGAMVTRAYKKCAAVLKAELGVGPSGKTAGLYKKLAQKLLAM